MTWPAPVTLSGAHATLEPLARDHEAGLVDAVRDGELWNLWYTAIPAPERMAAEIERRLALLCPEPGQGTEDPLGVGGDLLQHFGAMEFTESLRPNRADVTERAEICDLAGPVGGIHRQGREHLDLGPVLLVLAPLPGQFGPLTRFQVADRSGGDEFLTGIVANFDHREAVILGRPDHMDNLDRAVERGFALEELSRA